MAIAATKTEFNKHKVESDEKFDAIAKQLAILIGQDDSPLVEVQNVRAILESQIDALARQIAALSIQTPEPFVQQLHTVRAFIEDQLRALNQRLATLIGRFDREIPDDFGVIIGNLRADIEGRFGAVGQQIEALRATIPVDVAPAQQVQVIRANLESQITALNQRINAINQVNLQEINDLNVSVLEVKHDEQITVINQQIQNLQQQITDITNLLDEGDTISEADVINIVNNILDDIDIIDVSIVASSFVLNFPIAGDTWTGTEADSRIESGDKIFLQIQNRNITTRIAGKTTDFIATVEDVREGEFDWEIESMAKVFSGNITVGYTWIG